MKIILASKSPRRKELLSQIGVKYECVVSEKEEIITKTLPKDIVVELSAVKAQDVENKLYTDQERLIIGADTIVVYNNKILGKPINKEDASNTLKMLSGNVHEVYTGVSVIYVNGHTRKEISFAECTKVYMNKINDECIRRYIETNEPMDKAGSYAIQGLFAVNINKIDGDYNNVVGLPVSRLYNEVKEKMNIDIITKEKIMLNQVKACIFDLDGTTLDTVESIANSANKVLGELGLNQMPVNNYKRYAGDGQIELIKRALIDAGDTNLSHFEEAMERYIEVFETGCTYRVVPYDGIKEMFAMLKANNIKICIFSNKEHCNVVSILDMLFGEKYFDFVLGQKAGHAKKPSGEGIDIILNNICVDPKNCLYIGDTKTDMLTGKGYGLYTIGVTWGFRERQELAKNGADLIIDKPQEIMNLVNKIV